MIEPSKTQVKVAGQKQSAFKIACTCCPGI